jgi:hypothetical protein
MKHLLLALALFVFAAPSWAATCKISEYANQVEDDSGDVAPVAREPAVTDQTVTYTSSTQSTAFNNSTHFVRIVCDAKAHFQFGTDPTATANDPYIAADAPEYFGVTPGVSIEVAFYDGST